VPQVHAAVLDHVAFAVPRGADAVPFLVGELGARPHGAGPGPGYRIWHWRFAGGGVLEVLEPDGPPGGFLHRFLAAQGPGIHHVTFKVPRIADAMRRAEADGYPLVGVNLDFPAWKEAFLHPKQAQGIVVQLAESHPELEPQAGAGAAANPFYLPFPELPPPAAQPVEIAGLRLVARSAARARQQWEHTLLGRCEERPGELHFHWPDSPLRIAVEIDAAAEREGPLGIELAAPASLALPAGAHPILGARFLRSRAVT
jgi:methylmalonyl-CoA/ethylmalonyl-CoA epimerase